MGWRARRAARAIERGRRARLSSASLRDVALLIGCLVFTLIGVSMVGNGLLNADDIVGRRHNSLLGGVLGILFFGVLGIPMSLWILRSSWRTCVIDGDGVHLYSRCHLPWSSIVTAGVSGEGEAAQTWVELTPAGAAAEQRLVDDARETLDLRSVDGAPANAVLLPREIQVTPAELAELVRLATSLRTNAAR